MLCSMMKENKCGLCEALKPHDRKYLTALCPAIPYRLLLMGLSLSLQLLFAVQYSQLNKNVQILLYLEQGEIVDTAR